MSECSQVHLSAHYQPTLSCAAQVMHWMPSWQRQRAAAARVTMAAAKARACWRRLVGLWPACSVSCAASRSRPHAFLDGVL